MVSSVKSNAFQKYIKKTIGILQSGLTSYDKEDELSGKTTSDIGNFIPFSDALDFTFPKKGKCRMNISVKVLNQKPPIRLWTILETQVHFQKF